MPHADYVNVLVLACHDVGSEKYCIITHGHIMNIILVTVVHEVNYIMLVLFPTLPHFTLLFALLSKNGGVLGRPRPNSTKL